MKRISAILIVLLLVLCLSLVAGCDADVGNDTTTGDTVISTATLVLDDGTEQVQYTVDLSLLSDSYVITMLDYLVDNSDLHLVYTNDSWGAYITEVGTLVAGSGTCVSLYTSIDSQWDTSAYAETLTVLDTTVVSSGYGASSMTLCDGCIIYINLGSY